MHVVSINGSPRITRYSNTDKIVGAFERGLVNQGVTCERYAISDRNSWKDIFNITNQIKYRRIKHGTSSTIYKRSRDILFSNS